jgi:hypothetical protein
MIRIYYDNLTKYIMRQLKCFKKSASLVHTSICEKTISWRQHKLHCANTRNKHRRWSKFTWLNFVMQGLLINHYVPYEQHPTTKQQCNTQVKVNFVNNLYHDLYVKKFVFAQFFQSIAQFWFNLIQSLMPKFQFWSYFSNIL